MKSTFFHICLLMIGNGLAQALQVGAIFFLSRIYEPQDFGMLAQVQSIATFAVVIVTLQLHLTIPLSRSLDEAGAIASNVESLCFFISLAALPLAVWLGGAMMFASFVTLAIGLSNTYSSYLLYEGRFSGLSAFYVVRAILIICMQLLFAFIGISNGLLVATAIGEGVAAAYLRLVWLRSIPAYIDPREIHGMVVHNIPFSVYGTLQELISVSAFYAPLLFYTYRFGDSIAGHYAMANRLVWAPVILLSRSVAQVLYHRFSQSPPDTIYQLWDSGRGRLILIGALIASALSFLFEDFYLWVLGPKWGLASQLIPLQLTWGCIFLMSTPFRVLSRVRKLQKIQLWIDGVMLLAISALFMFSEMAPLPIMWGVVLMAFLQNIAFVLAISLSSTGRYPARISP